MLNMKPCLQIYIYCLQIYLFKPKPQPQTWNQGYRGLEKFYQFMYQEPSFFFNIKKLKKF